MSNNAGGMKRCFGCNEEGHIQNNCPKPGANQNNASRNNGNRFRNQSQGGNNSSQGNVPVNHSPTVFRAFHCVLHRDEKGRPCSSIFCVELKKLSFEERLKLLKENRDFMVCAGDCSPTKCVRSN